MNFSTMATAGLLLAALATTTPLAKAFDGNDDGDDDNKSYAIGLWGDLPYSAGQAIGVKNLIADMNSQKLAFTAHDGDLKAGGSVCLDTVYTDALGYFYTLSRRHRAPMPPVPLA